MNFSNYRKRASCLLVLVIILVWQTCVSSTAKACDISESRQHYPGQRPIRPRPIRPKPYPWPNDTPIYPQALWRAIFNKTKELRHNWPRPTLRPGPWWPHDPPVYPYQLWQAADRSENLQYDWHPQSYRPRPTLRPGPWWPYDPPLYPYQLWSSKDPPAYGDSVLRASDESEELSSRVARGGNVSLAAEGENGLPSNARQMFPLPPAYPQPPYPVPPPRPPLPGERPELNPEERPPIYPRPPHPGPYPGPQPGPHPGPRPKPQPGPYPRPTEDSEDVPTDEYPVNPDNPNDKPNLPRFPGCGKIRSNKPHDELRVSGGRVAPPGTIISPYLVLTAASCIAKSEKVYVRPMKSGGPTANGRNKDWIIATSACLSETSKNKGPVNDLAILKLKRPIKFNNEVGSSCLPTQKQATDTELYAVGLGLSSKKRSRLLQVLSVELTSCAREQTRIPKLCVSPSESGNQGAICNGDLGAPLLATERGRLTVYGIASYERTAPCDDNDIISVYTDVFRVVKQIYRLIDICDVPEETRRRR